MGCNSIGKRSALALAAAASMTLAPIAAEARGHGGWGGGWGGRGWRHHDRVDAGDIFAGILIIGGIAAIASAASKANKNRDTRREDDDRDYRGDDNYRESAPRYGERDDRPSWQEGRGIDGAVNSCVSEVERSSNRIETVDAVNRDGQGWKVEGRVASGRSFACSVDGDGRIRSVTVDGRAALAAEPADAG